MTETRLRSKRNLDAHIGSYIFYEDLYRSDRITTYIVPFVIGMLLARDSIVGISIPSSISLPASLFTRSVIHHLASSVEEMTVSPLSTASLTLATLHRRRSPHLSVDFAI